MGFWSAAAPYLAGGAIGAIGSLLGQKESAEAQRDINAQNIQMQREFAKGGIRWKVRDAKLAGIHPLYALGAQTHSFTPTAVGDTSMGPAYAQMGQDIGRAISATATSDERKLSKINLASAQATLDGQIIDNQIRASQLNKINQTGPAFPGSPNSIPGQPNADVVKKPLTRIMGDVTKPGKEVGSIPDYSFVETNLGGLAPVPSADVKERIEDQMIPELGWALRNLFLPNTFRKQTRDALKPPDSLLPKGANDWEWSYGSQQWFPVNRNREKLDKYFRENRWENNFKYK